MRIGLGLGLLTIFQFFTSLEVLALAAVTGGLCALGVVIGRSKLVALARKQILEAASIGALLTGTVLAYPIWYYLAGPRHVVGPYWPVSSSNPLSIFLAGPNVFNSHTSLTAVGYLGPQGPNTDYLGFGLLLVVVGSAPLWRRRRSCVILAGVGGICWVLEFIPSWLWARLPLLSSIELVRFALPVSLCVGLLIAASVDCWWTAVAGRWPAVRDIGTAKGRANWHHRARRHRVRPVGAHLLRTVSDHDGYGAHVVRAGQRRISRRAQPS